MNAKLDHVDEALMSATNIAFDRIFRPVRTVSRGEAKFNSFQPEQRRRLVGHWLSKQKDQDGWIADQLDCIKPSDILANFEKGDDAENGRLVAQALLGLARTIGEDDDYWKEGAR